MTAPILLLTASTGEGQSLRLHTTSLASPTSGSFAISFDAQGQPLPLTIGSLPAGFAALWQFPGSTSPWSLHLSPSPRYAFVGAAADDAVAISADARTVLVNGSFLDSSGNYVAGENRSSAIAATPTREGRYLLALDSSSKGAIAVLEIGLEGGKPTVRSAVVKSGANLPADTFGVLGAGITFSSDQSVGTVVFGDAVNTYATLYSSGAAGTRFSPLDTIPNPAGFHYVAATSAGSDGAFWVVGANGSSFEVRFLNTKTRNWDAAVVATIAKATGDVLIPAFDPYDPTRMLLVVSKVGSTPTYLLTGLVPGVSKGTLTAASQNASVDFSSAPKLPPVVLAPLTGAARGYLVGRGTGETSERLYSIDLTTGVVSASPIVFFTARHQTLVLEKPDLAPQSLSIRADSAGAVSGGQAATFSVTRTDTAGTFVVRYSTQSADGSAVAGRDYEGTGSGTVTMAAGSATAKISIPIVAVPGCAPQRTFSVKLTNTDATLTPPSEVQQAIASSTNCSFGVMAPSAAVPPGQPLTFTAMRSGTYLAGAQALPWTAMPGNSATTVADFSPASSTVTLPSGAATASFSVNTTPATLDCVPEKAVTVTVTPQGGASSSATGKIAPIATGCTVLATLTAPEKPYLPGDEITVTLSEVTPGRFDLAKATWTLTALGNTAYEKLAPTGSQGSALTLRFWSGTAAEAAGSVKVDYTVPALPGTSGTPATGTLTLDRVAFYTELVRLDGPAQYSIPAGAKKRYSLLWGGGTRKTTWLNPKAGNTTEKKTVRWSYWRGASQQAVTCERRVGEDCVFALPPAGDVTKVMAQVATGANIWATLAEVPVKGVPAPGVTAFEAVRYVPVALEFAGVGNAFFETELTLVNGAAGSVEAELQWGGLSQKEVVGAGTQVVVNGVVECLRETNPGQTVGVNPLKVTFRGLSGDSEKRLVGVMARTTTPAGAPNLYRRTGRAGLAYRGVPREELLGGAAGQAKSAWLIGLRGTGSSASSSVDRSNLAVTKPDPSDPDGVVDVELYGTNGTLVKTLAAQTISGFTQWANLTGVAGGTEVAYARVVWKSGGPVTTYATPVNNVSGDGSWVFPVLQETAGAATTDSLVLPVLFELPGWGEGNFRFVADAALAAPGAQTQTRLDYFWQGAGSSGTTSLANSLLGQTILGSTEVPGVKSLGIVQSLRSGTGSVLPPQAQNQLVIGTALLSRADGLPFLPGTLMAGARVDGPSSEQDATGALYGRFGIYLPAIPMRDLKNLAELRVLGLRQDSWVRSNLALINPGVEAVSLKLELQVTKADGSASSVLPTVGCGAIPVQNGLVTLPARTFCQIGTVLNAAGATSGYAILTRAGADAANTAKPYYAYGVVNDGADSSRGTSDGAYLLAELVPVTSVSLHLVDPPGTVNGALPAATVNAAYPKFEGTASPSGRTYTFSATGLPPGMSLGQGDNKWYLQGTPTQGGSFSINVTATDQAGATASKIYTLTVGACTVTLSPTSVTVSQQGSTAPNAFDVTTGASCKWTAVPKDSWLHVAVTTLQTGSQKVLYTWDASTASTRTEKIDIVLEGQTAAAATFTVTQTGGCSFTFDPPLTLLCQAGGEKTVTVTPSSSSCTGTFATDAPTWITPPTTPMAGQAITVTYTVAAVGGSSLNTVREGTLYIQGQPGYQTVRQSSPQAPTAGSNGPLCAGSALNLTATGGIANATWAWTGPNGFTSTLQNPSIANPTTAASGTYSVTQTINGCSSPVATTTVTVNPNPEITSFTAYPTSITKGQSSQLTAVFANGTGVITNNHSSDAIPVTSGTPVSVSPLVPTVYTLTVTSNQTPSCGTKTATASVAVDCPPITVNPATVPGGTVGVAYGPVSFSGTGGVGATTYAVTVGSLPGGLMLTPAGVLSGIPNQAGTFDFTVTATDSNGCTGLRAYSSVTIAKGTATVTITADAPDPSVVGQIVAVTVTVAGSGATPTGSVSVTAPDAGAGCTITLASGTGSCNLTFTASGSKTIAATYGGDGTYGSGTSDTEPHTVNQGTATVTITADAPDPSLVGQVVAVTVTVAVSGSSPTGSVTVTAPDAGAGCVITLGPGTGSCNLTFTTAGSKTITATYGGDANYGSGASDTEPHTVNGAAATVTITADSPDPSLVGQVVAVTATVAGGGATPTGSVTVAAPDAGSGCTITLVSGTGSCNLTFTTAGSKTITATYNGDANYGSGALDTEPHTVNQAAATVTITTDVPDPSVVGQAVAVTATVAGGSGTPTGTVTVTAPNAGAGCMFTLASGTGSCNLTFATAGSKTITATYGGDGNYSSGASDTEAHTVNQGTATVTITSDNPDPSVVGQVVAVTATVVGGGSAPTGTVTVAAPDAGAGCTITLASGTGSCNLTFTMAGSKTITATYGGDANYSSGASDTDPHEVNGVLLAEDFTALSDTRWQGNDSYVVLDGALRCNAARGKCCNVFSTQTFSPPVTIQARLKLSGGCTCGMTELRFGVNGSEYYGAELHCGSPCSLLRVGRCGAKIYDGSNACSSCEAASYSYVDGSAGSSCLAWYDVEIKWTGTRVTMTVNGQSTQMDGDFSRSGQIHLYGYSCDGGSDFDWITVNHGVTP